MKNMFRIVNKKIIEERIWKISGINTIEILITNSQIKWKIMNINMYYH